MNKEELKQVLPHREPMLLLDTAEAIDGGKKAVGTLRIKGDEWFVQGHFPENPVVPGVILCEIMAQTCCVLLGEQSRGTTPYFTGLNKVKFKNPVKPGDLVETECEIVKSKAAFFFAEGKVFVDGKLCASGEFSFALV